MIGEEAVPFRHKLNLSHPIKNGIVKDWAEMEMIWGHGFERMGLDPAGRSILVTEAALNPTKNKVKMAEVLFETFGFEKMGIAV